MQVTTHSPEETQAVGERLGRMLRPGDLVTLSGDLGAGKTTFAQGVGRGLEVDDPVSSPTFALVHLYEGRLPVWHLDTYRIHSLDELVDLSWDELLDGEGVVVVEWPDRIAPALPEERLDVHLLYGPGDTRDVALHAQGARMERLVAELTGLGLGAGQPG